MCERCLLCRMEQHTTTKPGTAFRLCLQDRTQSGTTKTKAIEITVETDGTIKASFQDYTITDKDEFVKGKDATPVGQEPPQEQTVTKEQEKTLETLSKEEIEKAREAAINYYKETLFEVESFKPVEYNNGQLQFAVRCKKEGKYVDPDRMAIVEQQKGTWKLVAEGY